MSKIRLTQDWKNLENKKELFSEIKKKGKHKRAEKKFSNKQV